MPQIAQILETYASQAFWLLIVFGILYFVIAKGMLGKVEETVVARDRKIATDLAAAEAARAQAVEMEGAWQSDLNETRAAAQAEAAAAKAKAQKDAENRLSKADAELAEKQAAAEAGVAAARASALASLEQVASEATADIVAKVSGAKVTAAQAQKAVKAVLANG